MTSETVTKKTYETTTDARAMTAATSAKTRRVRMNRRTRTTLTLLTAGAAAFTLTACQPDITRQRVEDDMKLDFANQVKLTDAILGKPAPNGLTDSVTCDKGGPSKPDRGPGKDWVCMVTYSADGMPTTTTRYELFVHGEACYTATDPALIEQPNITNAKGKSVANPLQQFDGCFDVYDNKTSITK